MQRRRAPAAYPILNASTDSDIESALQQLVRRGAGALLVGSACVLGTANREHLVALAAHHSFRRFMNGANSPVAGGLMSYGIQHPRCVSPVRLLCRPDSQGRETGRHAGYALHQIRVCDQPEDRQNARHRNPAHASRLCRRGDRMIGGGVHHAARRRGRLAVRRARAAAGPGAADRCAHEPDH